MIPNNNFSVLPWYTSIEEQNAKKWWVYGHVYPLFVPKGFMPPSQFIVPTNLTALTIYKVWLYNANTGESTIITTQYKYNYYIRVYENYEVVIYSGNPSLLSAFNVPVGRYYLAVQMQNATGNIYYSDVFTVVDDISPYLKIEWWDNQDFVMDEGAIVYLDTTEHDVDFKNVLYLKADIAKPEYVFEEEGETRDGYFFPVKQISEKRYKFNFLAPEYLLDAMRFIRMSDHVQITYREQTYNADSFLMTPKWEDEGDLAAVEVEFETATVAKKIGLGYTIQAG